MKQISTVKNMLSYRKNVNDMTVGFVPTMGALHEGHFSLIRRSMAENDQTVVSIYVNETQFNDSQDLISYPNTLTTDIRELQKLGVDATFLPNFQEMYPDDYKYRVQEVKDSFELCGRNRPGHFDGVLTVVLKLLNIVSPTRAYFGEKDFQQLHLIKGMVESFFMKTEIIACPIKRDAKGLALSSRNQKLNKEELKKAQFFSKQLQNASSLPDLEKELMSYDIEVDYLEEKNHRRFAAVKIGTVRLIDNVKI